MPVSGVGLAVLGWWRCGLAVLNGWYWGLAARGWTGGAGRSFPSSIFERLSMVILGGEPFQHPAGNGISCTSFWDNTSER